MFFGSDVRRGDRPELAASGEKLRGVDDLGFALERISVRRKLVFEGSKARRGSLRAQNGRVHQQAEELDRVRNRRTGVRRSGNRCVENGPLKIGGKGGNRTLDPGIMSAVL
jgi:hypothetical protein